MRSTELHRQVFRSGSKTYFNSSLFFPPHVRDDVFILYGFVRVADNYVDAVPQQVREFEEFVERYRAARAGKSVDDVIIESFVDLERRRGFESVWADGFLKSMALDITKRVYSTVEETLEYVYGSAEVIGLYMARIMDLDSEADEAAMMLGRAMQFINFIRDIDEDNQLGRVYLPLGETTLQDLSPETTRQSPDEFVRFIRSQLERYQVWQTEAEKGFGMIPRRYRVAIKTASDMYNWTASVIAKDPFIVYERKVKPARARILRGILWNLTAGGKIPEEDPR